MPLEISSSLHVFEDYKGGGVFADSLKTLHSWDRFELMLTYSPRYFKKKFGFPEDFPYVPALGPFIVSRNSELNYFDNSHDAFTDARIIHSEILDIRKEIDYDLYELFGLSKLFSREKD